MIEIHQSARDSINLNAESLLAEFKEVEIMPNPQRKTEHYISGNITRKDIIGDVIIDLIGNHNEFAGFIIERSGKTVGICDEGCIKYKKICDQINKIRDVSNIASIHFISDTLKAWLILKYDGAEQSTFSEYLIKYLTDKCKKYNIYIPIPFTSSEVDFAIGNMVFTTITEDFIESYYNKSEEIDSLVNNRRLCINKVKKEYQGYLFGIFEAFAEPTKVKELAYAYLADVLAIIRLFEPANMDPERTSGLYEYGWKNQEKEIYFEYDQNTELFREANKLRDDIMHIHFKVELIDIIKNSSICKLLEKANKNDFQIDLMNSIRIYSKSTLKKDIYDKLLYILVGLESILLRNDSEPIQQNLSDRIAFACGKNITERKSIVSIVKKVYSIRSGFIHHGNTSFEEYQSIEQFMKIAFNMFLSLANNSESFKTKLECIDAIEKIKYS